MTLFRACVLWAWLVAVEILKSHMCCHNMALSVFLLQHHTILLSWVRGHGSLQLSAEILGAEMHLMHK